jgi:hypothetical protein
MSNEIKKSDIEQLIEFLRGHPNSSKFLPSILKSYESTKKRIEGCNMSEDKILRQIRQVLSEQFVVSEKNFMELLDLTQEELRSRLKYLQSNYSNYFSLDKLDKNNWIIYITREGLKNE